MSRNVVALGVSRACARWEGTNGTQARHLGRLHVETQSLTVPRLGPHSQPFVRALPLSGNLNRGFSSSVTRWWASGKPTPETQTSTTNGKVKRNKRSPKLVLGLIAGGGILAAVGYCAWITRQSGDLPLAQYVLTGGELNRVSFVPFTVVSKEDITENSFILTVRPRNIPSSLSASWLLPLLRLLAPHPLREHSHTRAYEKAWSHGLWAVEIKQPQLQIAREYTPLPPITPRNGEGQEEDDGPRNSELRFFIRIIGGGEVSTYLSRLPVGATVELRGPHLGFDVEQRLGSGGRSRHEEQQQQQEPRRVVFLAGGTGIAPAMQVVWALLDKHDEKMSSLPAVIQLKNDGGDHKQTEAESGRSAVAENQKPFVSIIWANRQRADSVGLDREEALHAGGQTVSPIVQQLRAMMRRHRGNLGVRCVADEKGTFIDEQAVQGSLLAAGPHTGNNSDNHHETALPARTWAWGRWVFNSTAATSAPSTKTNANAFSAWSRKNCLFHSDELLERTATDPSTREARPCQCVPPVLSAHGQSSSLTSPPGRNLVLVSGPAGFIRYLAGGKLWLDGHELQGAVGGLLGRLKRKYPEQLGDWLVLKL